MCETKKLAGPKLFAGPKSIARPKLFSGPKFFWSGDLIFLWYFPDIGVKTRLHTKNWRPRCPGSGCGCYVVCVGRPNLVIVFNFGLVFVFVPEPSLSTLFPQIKIQEE